MTERPQQAGPRREMPAPPAGSASGRLAARLRSPRPLPHEVVALVYVVAGIAILENLPVTYPRLALVLAAGRPAAWFGALTLAFLCAREATARLLKRPRRLSLATEALVIVRAAVVLVPVLSVHFLLKSFVRLVNPRTWDALLWDLDRSVHLGLSPTVFLTSAFANGEFLRFLDVVYSDLYFLVIAVSVSALLVFPGLSRRMAFLAAYTFIWIAGSVLYIAFPSWGPVFVVSGLFAETLRHMPDTVAIQQVLFGEISSLVNQPLAPRIVRFGSVAAFPSLHLAVVTTFAVASRWVSRRWFLVNVVIVALMLIGSVVTGYHYLLDGWAGILLGLGSCALAVRLFPGEAADSGGGRETDYGAPGA